MYDSPYWTKWDNSMGCEDVMAQKKRKKHGKVLEILGNLPVERAKDAVCFLQWCGVSLVSSYAVCFLQRGGVSLASSAVIYNIVKVKVTRWPVWPIDPLTRRPVDLLEKEPRNSNCEVHLHTPLTCSGAKGAELDSAADPAKQKAPFAAVWHEAGAYII